MYGNGTPNFGNGEMPSYVQNGSHPPPKRKAWKALEPIVVPGNVKEIPRRSGVDKEWVMATHLREGEGTPLVITDAQDHWAAKKKWTLDYFDSQYGDDEVIVNDNAPLFHEDDPPMTTKRCSMREFCAYARGAECSLPIN